MPHIRNYTILLALGRNKLTRATENFANLKAILDVEQGIFFFLRKRNCIRE